MMSNKSICNKINLILFLGVFVLSFQFRGIFLQGNLKSMNIIATIAIVMLIVKYSSKSNPFYVLLFIYTILTMFISQYSNNKGIIETIVILLCILLPNYLILIDIPQDEFLDVFKLYIKFINIMTIFLIIFAVLDKITGASVAKFFAGIFRDRSFYNSVLSDGTNRYYSFMGHPLYNTQLFLMFYVINYCGNRYAKYGINMIIVSIISILGIGLCASKTGFILLIACLIFLRPVNNKWIYPIVLLAMVCGAMSMGIFDMLIYRLKTQTLTSGRNEVWKILEYNNLFPLKFWTGYGSGFNKIYNRYITLASAAFEYPIRLFALEYGILFSILIYIIIFIKPVFRILKNKQFILLISFGIIFADVNTYNGIGLGIDIMLMFSTYVYIIMNLSNYIKEKDLIEGEKECTF